MQFRKFLQKTVVNGSRATILGVAVLLFVIALPEAKASNLEASEAYFFFDGTQGQAVTFDPFTATTTFQGGYGAYDCDTGTTIRCLTTQGFQYDPLTFDYYLYVVLRDHSPTPRPEYSYSYLSGGSGTGPLPIADFRSLGDNWYIYKLSPQEFTSFFTTNSDFDGFGFASYENQFNTNFYNWTRSVAFIQQDIDISGITTVEEAEFQLKQAALGLDTQTQFGQYETRFVSATADVDAGTLTPVPPQTFTWTESGTDLVDFTISATSLSSNAIADGSTRWTIYSFPKNALNFADFSPINVEQNVDSASSFTANFNLLQPDTAYVMTISDGFSFFGNPTNQWNTHRSQIVNLPYPFESGDMFGFVYFKTNSSTEIECWSTATGGTSSPYLFTDCENSLEPTLVGGTGEVIFGIDYFIDTNDFTSANDRPDVILINVSNTDTTQADSIQKLILPLSDGFASTTMNTSIQLPDGDYSAVINFWNLNNQNFVLNRSALTINFTIDEEVITQQAIVDISDALFPSNVQAQETCGITNISGCINNSFRYLFYPSTDSLAAFESQYERLRTRSPFIYAYQASDTISGIYENRNGTFPTISVTIPFGTITFLDQAMLDAVPYKDTIRTFLAAFIWLFLFGSLYRKTVTLFDNQTVQ